MKSKMKRRMLAIVLCMVIALSNSSFIFASSGTEEPAAVAQEGDPQNVQETQTEAAVQDTPAVLSETTPEATPEATPEPTQVPEVTAAPTEAPQATAEPTQAPEVTAAPEATPVPTEAPAVTVEPTQAPEVTAAPETTPEATPVPTEAPVTYNEAVELKHEFKDENGNVTATVTAQIPAGAFQADASELTMEVTVPDQATTEHVKKLMEESLPEHYMLGDTVLYDIRFKVNGTETESQQPIAITFENQSGITVKDVKKAVVFQLDPADPAVEGDKDELVTITQRNDMIESLQNSGQSIDNVDDYDLSEITLKEDGTSDKIQMEGRTSTIYGCYAYYEPVQVLTYEDDQVTVTVSAAENGVIPANAELKVVPITEDKETEDQYKDVEKKLQEKAEEEEYEIAGFLAYDITFVDPDGNETEPNGEVKVSIDYKEAAIPESISEEDAQNAEVTVLHLEEDEKGEVKEVVDMAQNEQVDVLATTEENKVEKAEVRTESFSKFVIQWGNSFKVTVKYVKENGAELTSEKFRDEDVPLSIGREKGFEEYVKSPVTVDGKTYQYQAARINSVNDTKITKVKVTKYNYQYQYQYYDGQDWRNWRSNTDNRVVCLVYKEVEPLTTIETVDSSEKGITMKMIDLSGGDQISNNSGQTKLKNGSQVVDFGSGSGYGEGTIKDGLLEDVITNSNGFPNLKNGVTNLGTLFNGAKDVDQLFSLETYQETGYFEYSSFQNYAYLGENNTFTVYNQIGTPSNEDKYFYQRGNFMPYNTIAEGKVSENHNLYDEDGKRLSADNPRYNEDLYLTQGTNNFYFGMMIEAEFTQQRDGKSTYTKPDGTTVTDDMVYEFNGDDDMWVYIDDVLVLDIGGVHDAHSGKINFHTGVVEWTDCKTNNEPETYSTTLRKIFENAGILPSGATWTEAGAEKEFKGDTFADYTTGHSFKMYYLERGAGASNLHVKFNLPTVPKNTVNVQKVVQTEEEEDVNYTEDVDFLFQIEVDNALYTNQAYDIIENNKVVGKGVTDENAQFTLKHNQTARFYNISEDLYYCVKEMGAYLNGYEVEVDGTIIWTPDEDGSGTSLPSADSGNLNVGEKSTVIFINTVKHVATLSITKKMADGTATEAGKKYQILLQVKGKPFSGSYQIGSTSYTVNDGIIELEANQTATITGLPYGIVFEAKEIQDGSYLPTYNITGNVSDVKLPSTDEDGVSNGIYTASAQVNGNCQLIVTNSKIETGTGTTQVIVDKDWKDSSTYELPEYVKVTLYKDTTAPTGEYNEGDVIVAGVESKKLTAENNWHAEWDGLQGDIEYVVKEEYPAGYELVETTSDSTFTDITKIGDRNTPNSELVYNLGRNNILLVKETANKYFLWTPVDIGLDLSDIQSIVEDIVSLGLNGAGNLDSAKVEYKCGDTSGQGIGLTQNENGWTLRFSATSQWAMFWNFSYKKIQNITLTNTLDQDGFTSVLVKKSWYGDSEETRPETITVGLYQNDTLYEEKIINADDEWQCVFSELPIYTQNSDGTFTKNVYTVKETKIGDNVVDEYGRANGYQSSVVSKNEQDGTVTVNITNSKDWQIVKISESSESVKLEGAVFKLVNSDKTVIIYGQSDEDGVVKWFKDESCTQEYNEVIEDDSYSLEEMKAPSGYSKSTETWQIQISNGNVTIESSKNGSLTSVELNGKDTFYFKNTPLYDLPSAGGSGIFWYLISGTAFLMAASLILYRMKRKEVLGK